jgi:radical SAM protein with 4Fe4S-binding SPASM domain
MLTENCNYNCDFCIRKNISHKNTHISKEQIANVLNILHHEYPNAILILTGGEPTIHPQFIEILNEAVSIFKYVQIASNGSFGEGVASAIRDLLAKTNLFLQMSLDGTKEIHDSIRGDGAFDKVIHNLSRMNNCWNRVGLAATVPPQNYENIKQLAIYLNDFKFHSLKVTSVVDHSDSFLKNFSNIRWNSLVEELLPLCNYNLVIQKVLDFDLMDEALKRDPNIKVTSNCGRGKQQIYVNSQMDVLACTCQPETLGNILTDDFSEIKIRIRQSSRIQISPESVCYKCKYVHICNGGCPGYSTHFWCKPNMGDIRCPIVKEHYLKTHQIR